MTPSQLREVLFADYIDMADTAMRDRGRETAVVEKRLAFHAFLLGAGGDLTWGKFCEKYGFAEKASEENKEHLRAKWKRIRELTEGKR